MTLHPSPQQYSKQWSRRVRWLTYNRTRFTLLRENGPKETACAHPRLTARTHRRRAANCRQGDRRVSRTLQLDFNREG